MEILPINSEVFSSLFDRLLTQIVAQEAQNAILSYNGPDSKIFLLIFNQLLTQIIAQQAQNAILRYKG